MKRSKTIRGYFEKHPELTDRIDRLTGTISSLGTHAGGVIISDERHPITKFCALQRPADDDRIATLWDKKEIEKVGFVKYDILGLKSCAQVHKALEMINEDPYTDPDEEDEVFQDVVLSCKNKNIFQFETSLGGRAFNDLMPMSINELANASGIIRVVGSAEGRAVYERYKEVISRKQQGDENYWKEQLRDEIVSDRIYKIACDVLKDSYGVLIYQEQLAELISRISDGELSFGQGDIFRRLLDDHGKAYGVIEDYKGSSQGLKTWHKEFLKILKKYVLPYLDEDLQLPDVKAFLEFKTKDGELITPKSGIISWIISSAAYLFNKLHAIGYSINTYNMMWLKHFYPLEFWTASLQLEAGNLDKVRNYITAIKVETPEVKVLAPNINCSNFNFKMDKKTNEIQYGLKSIMSLGKSAKLIVKERKNGKYKSVKDFLNRVKVNRKVIWNLIVVKAFSDFGSQKKVWKEFYNAGIFLEDLPTSKEEFAIVEAKLLGVNISFTHPIMEKAAAYLPISDLDEGMNEIVAVKIMKEKVKQTKNGKNYKLYRAECLNTGIQFNIFDWQNREDIKDYMTLRIRKQNGFIQMCGPSRRTGITPYQKRLARKVLYG